MDKCLAIIVKDFNNPDFVKAIKSLYEKGLIELPDPVVGFYPDYPEMAGFEEIYHLFKAIENGD